nr:YihY family inner membrane protein [Comamonas sp. BIGb0124]
MVARLVHDLAAFPWRNTAIVLLERFREDRLGLTASSLTFTTMIALVPLFTVFLAVFSVFPIFAKLQEGLQQWLFTSLVPDNIARQVLGYMTQFAAQASRLGAAGLAIVGITALMLVLTIDRTLNGIWRVRQPRPLGQRVLVYWALITLGPLVMAASLSMTSYAFSASRGLVGDMPGALRVLFDSLEFAVLALGMTALYHYVPNARVKWSHALAGGIFTSLGIEIAKRVLALYVNQIPTYSALYGAFATVPILLIWIFTAWLIVLFGAVIAAYMPSLLGGVARRGDTPGWAFQLALEVVRSLEEVRHAEQRGLDQRQLVDRLRVDALQLVPVIETLKALDWIGQLDESDDTRSRYVLLVDPGATWIEPLVQRLLVRRNDSTEALWSRSGLPHITLGEAL